MAQLAQIGPCLPLFSDRPRRLTKFEWSPNPDLWHNTADDRRSIDAPGPTAPGRQTHSSRVERNVGGAPLVLALSVRWLVRRGDRGNRGKRSAFGTHCVQRLV